MSSHVLIALCALLLATTAEALHRELPGALRITYGTPPEHSVTPSWGSFLAFISREDLARRGAGATGRKVFVFDLAAWAGNHVCSRTLRQWCPTGPDFIEVSSDTDDPDNPTVSVSGRQVAFDTWGATGEISTRQIVLSDLGTTVITQVTRARPGADVGDSIRPALDRLGTRLVFQSTAPLLGGPTGVWQVFVYDVASSTLVQVTTGAGPSTEPVLDAAGTRLAWTSTADLLGDGHDTGVAQIFWADLAPDAQALDVHQLTAGNDRSGHPTITRDGHIFFDSAATNLPDTRGGPGTQVYSADVTRIPLRIQQRTDGPGDCSHPLARAAGLITSEPGMFAFVATGDLLANGTSGRRVFAREYTAADNGSLAQITARAVDGPIGYSLGSWFLTMVTDADLSGQGVCGQALHVVNFYPGHWRAATMPHELPGEPPPGDPNRGCDDGNVCTGTETCADERCLLGSDILPGCDDGDPCTVDACIPFRGCVHTAPCDDGNPCTGVETYDPVTCVCHAGAPVTCDDGNPCNGIEACIPATGACMPGQAVSCDDGNPRTNDTCDPIIGCLHTPVRGLRVCFDVVPDDLTAVRQLAADLPSDALGRHRTRRLRHVLERAWRAFLEYSASVTRCFIRRPCVAGGPCPCSSPVIGDRATSAWRRTCRLMATATRLARSRPAAHPIADRLERPFDACCTVR